MSSEHGVWGRRLRPARRASAGAGAGSERGFTLIEVLVASTLLIVSVLATLSMLDRATQTTAVSKQRDVANGLAQEMIERATGGRYTTTRNDLTDVDPGAAIKGPADRMRAALDPDGDQSSSAITPATITSGTLPVNIPQTWTVKRMGTTYTVTYRACTSSDTYQGVLIMGPFDCARAASDPPPGGGNTATSASCTVGLVSPGTVDPANPGQLTVKLQLLDAFGVSACVGALSAPLSDALCTLLGSSPLLSALKESLLGSNGALSSLLGGLTSSGASVGLCASTLKESGLAGASAGIGTSTRLAVRVAWTDRGGTAQTINQSALLRRGATT
jgi:type II secretory pathway pseudopilin PulG